MTGSDGFVGRWMMRHLAAIGDHAVALDPAVDVTDARGLREAVAAAAPESVIHLAAQASVAASWAEPDGAFAVNAVGTLHLVEAALACVRPPRVLLISSAEVYGIVSAEELPLGEDRPWRPVSPYAMSKAAAELVGLQAWLGRGLDVVRARPFNHCGPGQAPIFVVPSLARQVIDAVERGAGELRVGDVSVRRDLTDVRDVVRAYRLLLAHGRPGEVYNVCRGESVPIEDVARQLMALAGVDLPLVVDPDRLRPVDLPDLRGDPARLRSATAWVPEVPLEQTLSDVLASLDAPRPSGRS